jgi:hypothetical protein
MEQISFQDGEQVMDWLALAQALRDGHTLPKAEISDTFLYRGKDTLLNRAAWIDGLGLAVKSATVFPDNPAQGKPMINGGVTLYSNDTGELEALIDFHLITKWKTAGDSLCAALRLARRDSRTILRRFGNRRGPSRYYHQCHDDHRSPDPGRVAAARSASGPDRGLSPRHARSR